MARFAIIDAGRVINHAEASEEFADQQGWVPAADSKIGDFWDGKKFTPPPAPEGPSQFEKDQSRYTKRAAVKDELMAYMAADNMSRVRSGVWSVADLTALLDDPAVVAANALMGTLSFELAAQQIQAATTPLLTPDIKADWTSRLEEHYYLEG
ncbi:MAG: hypothetical protein ITG01_11690 [Comamonas sp.]|nr:hypothetical protein [Comamonas sp.]